MERRAWSPDEIDWLRENWQLPDADLCAHLNRSVGTIRTKRRALGLIGKKNCRKSDWSQDELDYLDEVWGERTIPEIAKKLGRSVNAVKVKSVRLGYPSQKWYGGMMSARKVSELLGVDVHAVTDFWIRKCGLKGKNKLLGEKGRCTIIHFDDLLKWLEANQDKWDSRRVGMFTLGPEPDWLKEKRKADAALPERRLQKWTTEEDAIIIDMFKSGRYTYQQIGDRVGRSADGAERRLARLDVWGTGKYVGSEVKRQQRAEHRENIQRLSLIRALRDAILCRRNQLAFDGYWQKDMCMLWDDIKGCKAGEADCDSCISFQRIRERVCARCGGSFFERNPNRFCAACRQARKKQQQRKWARAHARAM